MFKKFFGKKINNFSLSSDNLKKQHQKVNDNLKKKLSLEEQRNLQIERKRNVINEFGKSLINFQIETGIWTSLFIVDFYEVNFREIPSDFVTFIEEELDKSLKIHKENLKQKIYRESFNLQPAETLIVIKEINGEVVLSFKNFPYNIEKLAELLNARFFTPDTHKILFLTYFIPPIPDDVYKLENIIIPNQFELVIKDIVNYCDRHFNTDNLTLQKWETIVNELNRQGLILRFPDSEKIAPLSTILTEDYSTIGYHRLKIQEFVRDKIEKNPVVIPFFIMLLALFCTPPHENQVFSYHDLFSSTGLSKERSKERKEKSFVKLFNKLLDESLLPNQFRKCLSTIYYEGFILHQYEVDDLLFKYREQLKSKTDLNK